MSDANSYLLPKIWIWNKANGGQFANINRPIAGSTHEHALPRGKHPLQPVSYTHLDVYKRQAHDRVDDQRHDPRFRTRLDFLQHANQRQRPHDTEQRPAPRPAQGDQAERRVAAGDQQVDRQVVELAQDGLGPPAHAVIDRCV